MSILCKKHLYLQNTINLTHETHHSQFEALETLDLFVLVVNLEWQMYLGRLLQRFQTDDLTKC